MKLTSDILKVKVLEHIISSCPLSVWEHEYQDRKHLTTKEIDKERSPGMVMSISEIVWIPGSEHPIHKDLEDYISKAKERVYTKTGKFYTHPMTRKSKKKDKDTGCWIRSFSCGLVLMDHSAIVITDPADENVMWIEYVRDTPCFNSEPK